MVYKKLINGMVADPSFAKTPQPAMRQGSEASPDAVIRASRERFAKKRDMVEQRIERWFKGRY